MRVLLANTESLLWAKLVLVALRAVFTLLSCAQRGVGIVMGASSVGAGPVQSCRATMRFQGPYTGFYPQPLLS